MKKIRENLGAPTNFIIGGSQREFFFVVEFSRSKIGLNEDSMGLILQSYLGGNAARFDVVFLRDHYFRFSDASKDVGFSIYNGGNIANEIFNLHFFLRGNGVLILSKSMNFSAKNKQIIELWFLVQKIPTNLLWMWLNPRDFSKITARSRFRICIRIFLVL